LIELCVCGRGRRKRCFQPGGNRLHLHRLSVEQLAVATRQKIGVQQEGDDDTCQRGKDRPRHQRQLAVEQYVTQASHENGRCSEPEEYSQEARDLHLPP
jgi:hypothetical protein